MALKKGSEKAPNKEPSTDEKAPETESAKAEPTNESAPTRSEEPKDEKPEVKELEKKEEPKAEPAKPEPAKALPDAGPDGKFACVAVRTVIVGGMVYYAGQKCRQFKDLAKVQQERGDLKIEG